MGKGAKVLVGVLAAVIVVAGLGFAGWWFFVRTEAAPKPEIEETEVEVAEGDSADGAYTTADGSFAQYRVQEQLAGSVAEQTATGRTDAVTGSLTVTGTTVDDVEVTADLTQLTSDRDRRDSAIRTRGLETDTFPEATFVLTQPIELPSEPVAGETVEVSAVGDLTLHGVTRSVEIPIEARWDGRQVQVVGELPIAFADYAIEAPSVGGFVEVRDEGTLELQLFFDPT